METVKLFDINVAAINMEQTIKYILNRIDKRLITQHVVINAAKVVLMENDLKLKKIIENCPLINADGQSIVWASKILGRPLPERVTGIDLMENLIKVSVDRKYRIYFFGAKEEVVTKVISIYKNKYPDLQIAGYRNGYFKENEVYKIIDDMKKSNADILFVAFSSPKKEYWLSDYMKKINIPFCMGVGGSFDIVAGKTKRAPHFMQKMGLEWFFRVLQEPRRMWKRYLIGNIKFIYIVFKKRFDKR